MSKSITIAKYVSACRVWSTEVTIQNSLFGNVQPFALQKLFFNQSITK